MSGSEKNVDHDAFLAGRDTCHGNVDRPTKVLTKRGRRYPVKYDNDEAIHNLLWPQNRTSRSVMLVLRILAEKNERTIVDDRHWPADIAPLHIYFQNGQLTVRILEEFSRRLHHAIQQLHYSRYSRKTYQKDGEEGRFISKAWRRNDASPSSQLKSLKKAIASGSLYKFEASWRSLKPAAMDFLQQALIQARQSKSVPQFHVPLTKDIEFLSAPLPDPDYIALIVDDAIALASSRNSSPTQAAKDRALVVAIRAYLDIAGKQSDGMIKGGCAEPQGEATKFVRTIEQIFDIDLLPHHSLHAVRRARKLNQSGKDWLRPSKLSSPS